jgi:outer membrane receptor for ferrienterochelin and colicins
MAAARWKETGGKKSMVVALVLLALAQTTEAESQSQDISDAGVKVVASSVQSEAPKQTAILDDPAKQTVVTSTRTPRRLEEVVVATEVITRAQIEQLGVRDLPQLIQQHPGVEMVYTNRGVGLRLQGLDPEYVLILVDGQRVAGRSGSITDISRFSLRDIERVEIVKGPGAALYGADAIGGVINLITRHPQKKLEGSVRGMFGTLLEGDVRANAGSKMSVFEVRGGAGYRTRQAYDWDPSDAASSGPALRRIDGDFEAAYVPTEFSRTWVRGSYVLSDFNAVDLNTTGATFDRFQRTEQADVYAGTSQRIGEATGLAARVHFGLFRDQFLVDQRGSRALDEYSRNLTRFAEASVQFDHQVGRHFLSAGLEGFFEYLLSSRLSQDSVDRGRLGGYFQDEWVLAQSDIKLSLLPGVRLDGDTRFGLAPSPRIAAKIDVNSKLNLRMAYGLGFRPPSFSELFLQFSNAGVGYVVQGNQALKAETSQSLNISLDAKLPWDGFSLSASAWHTSLKNLINVTASGAPNPDDPARFSYENVADAYTQGLELSMRAKISRGAFVEASYMGLDARDLTRGRALEGRSPHRVNLQLGAKYKATGLEGVVRASWHAPRPFYVGDGLGFANVLGFGDDRVVYAKGYVDLEFQLTYTRWFFKIFVNGYNLLNSGDQQFNPRPPRGILGGVQLDL